MKAILVLLVFLSLVASAQTKKAPRRQPKQPSAPTVNQSQTPIFVNVKFKNGKEVYGRLIDISPQRISVDPEDLDVVVISNLSDVVELRLGERPKLDPAVMTELDTVCNALASLAAATANISYSEYQQKLTQTKAIVGNVLQRLGSTEYKDNPILISLKKALYGFETASSIWALRVGAEQHKYVFETSSLMQLLFEHYPEVKTVDWRQGDRWLIERLIPWLWVQASAHVEAARLQLARLK
ncbi:MAG: hypothetical protein RMM17_00170 [Acidobacteriota bacterium]|nr:hypothetical protein [Blastocatellia bacterium]MDW8411080.1 hypothetical protein [Acidobacteriota bacterium]